MRERSASWPTGENLMTKGAVIRRTVIFVSFRCVDEVVIGAPYTVTKALMDHFSVSNRLL